MKIDRKAIQLSLVAIGIILILSTYFLYPRISNKITAEKKILTQEKIETADEKSNYFENVEYTGLYNINNRFSINSKKAFISNEEPDIVHMTNMKVTLEMKDGRIVVITSDTGVYNKKTYDCFFVKNVKATDGETVLNSENMDLLASVDTASIYNGVILTSTKGSLVADKIEYDFQTKYYKVSMFKKERVKVKLTR